MSFTSYVKLRNLYPQQYPLAKKNSDGDHVLLLDYCHLEIVLYLWLLGAFLLRLKTQIQLVKTLRVVAGCRVIGKASVGGASA